MHGPSTDAPHLADALEAALDAEPEATRWSRRAAPPALLVRPTVPRLLRLALVEWAGIALGTAAMAALPTHGLALVGQLALLVFVAGRYHGLGVILHDAAHMPLRGKTAATHALELLAGFPIGTTLNAMRYHHLRHHKDSGMPSDPYWKRDVDRRPLVWLAQWLRGVLLLPFWAVRAPFGALAWHVPALRGAYARVFLQDRSGDPAIGATREVAEAARAEHGQVLFQLALLAAALAAPRAFVHLYVAPLTLTGLLASYRLLCEHRYVRAADRRVETIVATTYDHHLGWLGRLVLAPRNIGYHVVHHLHPQVSLEHLPALRRWYVDTYGAAYVDAARAAARGDAARPKPIEGAAA
jgi:fatty acid desaturase